jgi:hypothetical protein
VPHVSIEQPGAGEALLWFVARDSEPPAMLRIAPSDADRTRHRLKYAEGSPPPDRSFYFRGPDERLNLRAQNLVLFSQIADGVDDQTWLHHLRQGDYSRWMREAIKDEELADEVRRIEAQAAGSATESRRRIRAAIAGRYTLPAEGLV